MYLIGFDIGSSSIKAALVPLNGDGETYLVQSPETEMEIVAPHAGWAEQHPETWWNNVCLATKKLLHKSGVKKEDIKGIGIGYQMHGLVLVDKEKQVLRPSIIWCDSRAVQTGDDAFQSIGNEKCLSHLLNSPGNFTASKLAWVKENEPEVYSKVWKMMLPGDYIAMRLTGEVMTTPSGLSEGMLWDFQSNGVADFVLDHFGIDHSVAPEVVDTFSNQGKLSGEAAESTGLLKGTPVTYRAGDQPNNALSLNVLNPGEVAATGGTSGVVYGVVGEAKYDPQSRVNGFAHVNHSAGAPRVGVLLCINGAGIQYSWTRKQIANNQVSYLEMEKEASSVPAGSDGLRILPFGNGAERMFGNRNLGSKVNNLHFNRHTRSHFYRAALEGVAFSFVYGMGILQEMGMNVQVMRVGNDNLFQSQIFSQTISNLIGSRIEMVEATGAIGAAKAAGVGIGLYSSISDAMQGGTTLKVYEPLNMNGVYRSTYQAWLEDLNKELK